MTQWSSKKNAVPRDVRGRISCYQGRSLRLAVCKSATGRFFWNDFWALLDHVQTKRKLESSNIEPQKGTDFLHSYWRSCGESNEIQPYIFVYTYTPFVDIQPNNFHPKKPDLCSIYLGVVFFFKQFITSNYC